MHVAIIGNGISGITAARWIRKLSDHKITVISSESEHFYSRTALMYIYMGHMRFHDTKPYEDWFWEKNKIDLIHDHVESINFQENTLQLTSENAVEYDHLILALGSSSNKFGWPGQDLNRVGGLYNLQDLEDIEGHSTDLNRAVIAGGGLIGIELAEMYRSRSIPVTMLVREGSFWNNVLPSEESAMINREILKHHIDLKLNSNLQEIVDDGKGNACAVIVKESGERIECGYVGLTAGVSPNIRWLKESSLATNRGILVDKELRTNIPNVWAIGDCAELQEPRTGRRGVEAIWYTGRMMGETCAYNICGNKVDYDPGIWFNSAKFLDIEYQVYGQVSAVTPEDSEALYWEHPDGNKSVRIIYNKVSQIVEGFNLMGIRFRHEVCEKWLREETNIVEVLSNLKLALF
ncbi:MAG: NADPH-dependent 2,4-dienoyl-CoA reductase/sulfur reductase-like enzyme, partial [Saprospiraceae bacterium]